jgi:hypothetical protein
MSSSCLDRMHGEARGLFSDLKGVNSHVISCSRRMGRQLSKSRRSVASQPDCFCLPGWPAPDVGHRHAQIGPFRQNHGLLDNVLQFADISQPIGVGVSVQNCREYAIDPPVHPLRVLPDEVKFGRGMPSRLSRTGGTLGE